jgi:pimeloyl-ACP methyl ester carboxylesterase
MAAALATAQSSPFPESSSAPMRPIRLAVGRTWALALAWSTASALAAAGTPAASPCQDRLAAPPAGNASVPPARLAGMRYTCTGLASGQHVLVAEAGQQHLQTVLLVHGLGNNAHRDWGATIEPLAQRFHVVALDLPGFGASQAPAGVHSFEQLGHTLAEVLDRHAPGRRVHVVGHSLGGAASLHFAHRHADRVERLVLVDAAGILHKSVFAQHLTRPAPPAFGIEPVDRFLAAAGDRVNALHRGMFGMLDDRFDFSRWLVETPRVRQALLGGHTQVDAALGLVEHDFTQAIRELRAPTTVIWGRDDPVAPLRTGVLLAARLPDARWQVIDGAQHVPMTQQPLRFNSVLMSALAEPPAPRFDPEVPQGEMGKVACRNAAGNRYSGVYESLTLENCHGVRIENARIGRLVMVGSSATLEHSVIDAADGVALDAQRSRVMATAVRLKGRIALRAAASHLDFAGTTVSASEKTIEMPSPSRVYFSVSDVEGAGRLTDAHRIWPVPAAD